MTIQHSYDPLAEAIHQYGVAEAYHDLNTRLMAQGSDDFCPPPQIWMLTLDCQALVERAKRAELMNPKPICGATKWQYYATGPGTQMMCQLPMAHACDCNYEVL